VEGTDPNPNNIRLKLSFALSINPPLLKILLSCSLKARGNTEIKVTATSLSTTSLDQILSPRGVEGSEAAKATRFPIETVAKLKGKEPIKRVMKNGLRGNRRTPEMTCENQILH